MYFAIVNIEVPRHLIERLAPMCWLHKAMENAVVVYSIFCMSFGIVDKVVRLTSIFGYTPKRRFIRMVFQKKC